MQKIAQFMMSKKFIPVILVLTAASLFMAFQTQGKTDNDNPKSKYAKVLRNVGIILEQGHYSPKKIDDNFEFITYIKYYPSRSTKQISSLDFNPYLLLFNITEI